MICYLLRKTIARHKELLLKETLLIEDFMHLLMRPRNTGEKWTSEEKKQLRAHVKHLSAFVPALIIFLLPGGAFILPTLAEILDRRSGKREK